MYPPPAPRLASRPSRASTLLLAGLLPFFWGCFADEPTAPHASPGAASADGEVAPAQEVVAPGLTFSTAGGGVVISQLYGGGGNSGAPFTHDFVELFNAGSAPHSLQGLSIQYTSATGTGNFGANAGQLTQLPNVTLQPGQYFLVQQAGGANGEPLPTPDVIDSAPINMAAASGKVALVTGTSGLGCNGGSTPCGAEQLERLLDLVGYGTANFFEGSGAAPQLSNTLAGFRADGGCTDTDDNAADFAAAPPSPRNSGTPLNPCQVVDAPPTVTATSPVDGASDVALDAVLTVTFSAPVTVTGDWFAIDCTSSGAVSAAAEGGPTTWTLTPGAPLSAGEICTVTILAAGVDGGGDPPLPLAEDFEWSFTTLGGDICSLPFTPIPTIQGSGAVTPLLGQTVTTQGVVIGDFQGPVPTLRGFYIQDPLGDGDPATSDGIFVFNGNNVSVALGELVRVSGTAQEFQEQTQIGNVSALTTCGTGFVVEPTDVTLPFPSQDYLERYEGMLVRLPQTLHVTEHFQLGRFGQVVMSSGGRLFQPTNVAPPGSAAAALQAANDLNRILVDDELNNQNPDPIRFGRGGEPLSASNTLRGGDTATGIVGVMTYSWAGNAASGNAFRVRPVNALGGGVPEFQPTNPRPAAPDPVGGSLKVAAFNLLNYFNTFTGCTAGVGGPPVGCRGADNPLEFDRQWPKTVAAILGMDVHIVGLIEMENDGYGPGSAIADLVSRLNGVEGPGVWDFIDADIGAGEVNALGTDAIKVGFVYRTGAATPIGNTAVLNSEAFVNGGDLSPRNRPSLAQAFQDPAGGRVVVNVNHLKSKGSACDVPDLGDGQGNCSVVRANATRELLDWLRTDPTGTGDSDVLIIGDLNAYAMEDPIRILAAGGYRNLAPAFLGSESYSYVFNGQWGSLDHALASASLSSQVTGATVWHINADEPNVLDYNTNFKSPGQVASLYAPDAFRSSDHDPVLVGLELTPSLAARFGGFLPPVASPPAVNRVQAGRAIPIKFSLGGDFGLELFAGGYPASRAIPCGGGEPGELIDGDTPGESGLSYETASDSYTWVWATDRAWRGSCRELVLRFRDGSQVSALFRFRG